ncbi:S24 family peptidase [Consotaella salsifontis]|uniref:Phage repressor protein C, contains Cro/C1-type HTH and peptisase s24 domains n=1 Tax=Consotaella salsifontis TaxID=1365950 RepID=A0A1T4T2W8_9HYPH|nr:helix-turn-helix transcriptional regulator [Consotaella salsifontis]SKA34860.1 Phage repressor protein C, contains Cro/C1-type HTH and peptisase s24 domains [Consotaella salsifontis]
MFSHDRVWAAIDAMAARQGLSPSGLARRAGLDPTTFNKSKRNATDGRPRWPSTESISKIIQATNSSFDEFADLVREGGPRRIRSITVPLLGLAQAGGGGYFDDAGFPAGQGWDEIQLPPTDEDAVYALEVTGQSMMPLYREGDIVIVSPTASLRRGDRVVVKTREGEVMAKVLQRQTAKTIELASLNPDFPPLHFNVDQIDWMARILWASQ